MHPSEIDVPAMTASAVTIASSAFGDDLQELFGSPAPNLIGYQVNVEVVIEVEVSAEAMKRK
jgi:hypothetical protein